ncbi:MAG: hypothetical protein JWO46_2651 [Nocardioidaceae bacterium]|nr:hypothetical protein [Nocardioidaceae bacterium]
MILGPTPGELDDDQVLAAYPWPAEGLWVRAMMVTTLDGAAAGPDGLSGSISGDADTAVFDAVRRLADVVLIGSGTMRAERYGPMQAKPADAEARRAAGQSPAPVIAIVSGSLDLPWEEKVFSESEHIPLVLTGPSPEADALATARQHSEVVLLVDTEPATVVAELERRGLRRIVCEGGPHLLEAVVAAGLLDEADITLSPLFAGTAQAPRTPGLDEVASLHLVHVLTEDDFLMARYVRDDA